MGMDQNVTEIRFLGNARRAWHLRGALPEASASGRDALADKDAATLAWASPFPDVPQSPGRLPTAPARCSRGQAEQERPRTQGHGGRGQGGACGQIVPRLLLRSSREPEETRDGRCDREGSGCVAGQAPQARLWQVQNEPVVWPGRFAATRVSPTWMTSSDVIQVDWLTRYSRPEAVRDRRTCARRSSRSRRDSCRPGRRPPGGQCC